MRKRDRKEEMSIELLVSILKDVIKDDFTGKIEINCYKGTVASVVKTEKIK